jgi:hypothetical protein
MPTVNGASAGLAASVGLGASVGLAAAVGAGAVVGAGAAVAAGLGASVGFGAAVGVGDAQAASITLNVTSVTAPFEKLFFIYFSSPLEFSVPRCASQTKTGSDKHTLCIYQNPHHDGNTQLGATK